MYEAEGINLHIIINIISWGMIKQKSKAVGFVLGSVLLFSSIKEPPEWSLGQRHCACRCKWHIFATLIQNYRSHDLFKD
jgi:hypothetical protein